MKPLPLLGAVLFAACSPSAVAEGAAQPINACGFLKDAEVTALVQAKVEPSERKDVGDVGSDDEAMAGTFTSTCLWRIAGAPAVDPSRPLGGASFVILNVMQWPAKSGGGKKFLQTFHDAAKTGEIGQEPVPVKIGEQGLWWGDGVAVSKGDRAFGISVHLVGGRDKERGIEEALARKIAGRL